MGSKKKDNMKLTKDNLIKLKNDLDANLDNFFRAYYADQNIPVDIFAILERLNFDVYYGKLPRRYDGIMIVDENATVIEGFNSNKVIAANSKLSYRTSVFTLAHELAHYLAKRWLKSSETEKLEFEFREHTKKGERDETENFMDFIAASILMPKKQFIDDLENAGIKNAMDASSKVIDDLAAKYDVEYEAARRRIDEVLS